ncbi:MAG: FAD-dependent oxidoreductase [Desulfobacterales bacterium]|nr:FAD-dependent oxidoreductase [Desulfobacterales bacterium]
MTDENYYTISGKKQGKRIDSRILEEMIQSAVSQGHSTMKIQAFGQHGIGGRLRREGSEPVRMTIDGHPGQRVGSMGFPNTFIEIMGPASDDVGWLNAGAEIIVNGHAANGCANAMAQGKIYVAGNIGSRGMTMTKYNPKYDSPELWVLGSVGDYFGEFMAGGVAVVCGYKGQNPENILGHRPLVGMVGGRVFSRGPHKGYSQSDAKIIPITDEDWNWLLNGLKNFLEKINRAELFEELSDKKDWHLMTARSPHEKASTQPRSMTSFRQEVWNTELGKWGKDLGKGGLYGDIDNLDRSPVPLIPTGDMRRFVPKWENREYMAPCEASCPTGIPVHERWRLIRDGRVDEAVDMALAYTPFPATVCGYLCPNLCMQSCTRQLSAMAPVDITSLGKASINAKLPSFPAQSGKKIAVIGGGPAGISVAWQLLRNGHEAVIYDMADSLGGKLKSAIPGTRIPDEVLSKEMERIRKSIPHVFFQQRLNREDMEQLREDSDFAVVSVGSQKPVILPVPGKERMITHLDFLAKAKENGFKPGKCVVIIGAGNVGCDVATEAHRLGAEDITLIDIQEPLSFGEEREAAVAVGAKFRYPCFTKEITEQGVVLDTGELIPADTVFISIGDKPDLDFLPGKVETERGFIKIVNEHNQTTDPKIFAIGDAVKPGLLTDAIGSGRKAAQAIIDILNGKVPSENPRRMIDRSRITLEYFDPRITGFDDLNHCGSQCSSCGACRDCGICVAVCPQSAISRQETEADDFEMTADETKCIGCGFCARACPCGIWNLVENEPVG